MTLIDTSAWIEFLRDTGSPACDAVDRLLDDDIAVCDPVIMEVLAGARDEGHLQSLRGLLGRASVIPATSVDYESAAALYRRCRTKGRTVRALVSCLIAAIALRTDVAILHADADFDTLAELTPLRIHPL